VISTFQNLSILRNVKCQLSFLAPSRHFHCSVLFFSFQKQILMAQCQSVKLIQILSETKKLQILMKGNSYW